MRNESGRSGSLLATFAGLSVAGVAVQSPASAAPPQAPQPVECAQARQLYAQGRTQDWTALRRICLQKMAAQLSASPPSAPGSPKAPGLAGARAPATSPGHPASPGASWTPSVYPPPPPHAPARPAPGSEVAAEPSAAPGLAASLDSDRATAKAAHVDTSIFGIALGGPLRIPPCPAGTKPGLLEPAVVPLTCQVSPESPAPAKPGADAMDDALGVFTQTLQSAFGGFSNAAKLPGETSTVILLSDADRPTWLTAGSMSVSQIGGKVVAVELGGLGTRLEQEITARLAAKYHRPPTEPSQITCKNNLGIVTGQHTVRLWSMAGVRVEYTPVIGACVGPGGDGAGSVRFETATYLRLKNAVQSKQEAGRLQL